MPRPVRNWARSPRRTLQWIAADIAHAAGRDVVVQIRPGWTIKCHPGALRFAYQTHLGIPDQIAELDSFIASCSPGMRLIDVGAHFGLFSLAALHFGGPEARALAIDPSGVAITMLNSQARLNSLTSRMQILKVAIGNSSGTIQLVDAGVMSSGYMVPDGEKRPPNDLTTVKLDRLDDLVSTFDFRPTHVKIDVEGEEAAVIEGALQLLAAPDAPLLFVELHNRLAKGLGRRPEATLDMLVGMNYSLFTSDGRPREVGDLLNQDLVRIVAAKQTQLGAVNRIRSAQLRSASSSP